MGDRKGVLREMLVERVLGEVSLVVAVGSGVSCAGQEVV